MQWRVLFLVSFCFILDLRAQDSLITTPPQNLIDALSLAKENNDIPEQTRAIYRIADYFDDVSNYDLSEEYFKKALEFSYEHNYLTYVGNIKLAIATLYRYRGDYKKSLELCYEALEIETELEYRNGVGSSYYNIAIVFYYTENFTKAIEYSDSAIAINRLRENKDFVMNVYSIKALALSKINEVEKALQQLELPLQYYLESNDSINIFSTYTNIGVISAEAGQNTHALENFKIALNYCPPTNLRATSTIIGNIAAQYTKLGKYDAALENVNRSLEIAIQIGSKPLQKTFYEEKVGIYKALGNYEEALNNLDKFLQLKDEILNAENIATIQEMESKYKNREKEKDLKLKQHQIKLLERKRQVLEQNAQVSNLKIYSLIGCSLFLLIPAFLIYRNQTRKRKHESLMFQKEQQLENAKKELIQSELEKTALHNQQLTSEIEYKNKELQNLAQHIVQKNDLLEKLKQELKAGSNTRSNQLIQMISVGMDIEKEGFEQQIDHISSLFYKNLKTQFPELTANDLRLLSLIKINMSSKEISILLNINPKSVDMARYRLRKKMKLSQEINLFDFLNQF
jgi:tetratricopeptide (TPR) repeat protein